MDHASVIKLKTEDNKEMINHMDSIVTSNALQLLMLLLLKKVKSEPLTTNILMLTAMTDNKSDSD